jgi:hypothetical protein
MSRKLITGLVFLIFTIFAVLILFDSDMNLGRSNVTQAAELSETSKSPEQFKNELQQLLLERKMVLSSIVDSMKIFVDSGRIGLDAYMDANIALLRAEMDLCQRPNERLEILQKIVQFHRECEAWTARRATDGRATQMDVDKAKAARLEAQIELAREKLKLQSTE